jgi:hypothetical protein
MSAAPDVGVAVLCIPEGLGVIPVVPFPASEVARDAAARETGRAAKLLARPSAAQIALFRLLCEHSPDGRYVVESADWIDTMLKATKGVREEDVAALRAIDWTPSSISSRELRKTVLALVRTRK